MNEFLLTSLLPQKSSNRNCSFATQDTGGLASKKEPQYGNALDSLSEQVTPLCIHRLSFVSNLEGEILHLEQPDGLSATTALLNFEHKTIEQLLLEINPQWENKLPSNWLKKPSSLFLNLEGEKSLLPYGFVLEGLIFEDKIYGSLSRSLVDQEKLCQCAVTEIPAHKPYVAELFFRLQSAESRLSNYLKNFPGVFFSQRPDCSFSYISNSFETWIGKKTTSLFKSGSAFLQLIVEEDRENFISEIVHHSQKKETFSLSYRLRLPNGNILHLMDVRTPQLSPSGLILAYEGVWIDVTRQAIAEDKLRRSAWKESLAVLTGGLLHDFSNIMAGIFSVSELYDSTLEKEHPWKAGLLQIQKSAKEAQALVRRILELHKEVESRRDYFNLNTLIREQRDLLHIILPKGTSLHLELPEQELPVYLDDVRFRQSLLNLALNTRDALNGNPGEVCIKVKTVSAYQKLGEGFLEEERANRDALILSFSDNAGGIPKEVLNKIFSPFFTTKDVSKGSGFGLYNAKLFVEESGGKVGVASIEGRGSTFYLCLPLSDFTEEAEELEIEVPKVRRRITLYAQEDPSHFRLTECLLEKGWEVMPCHGEKALFLHLKDTAKLPQVLLLIELGKDKAFESIIEKLRQTYPQIFIIAQRTGEHNSLISAKLKGLLDRVLDRDASIKDTLQVLTQFADKVED